MSYSLQNIVSACPNPSNIGYNNSWIRVQNNANRELFANASYITNFSDLSISLSAADLNIGTVHISDPNDDQIKAGVAVVGPGLGALRVLSQDLEANVDTVSLGDINNNNVGINSQLSALKVFVSNTQPVNINIYEDPIVEVLSVSNCLSSNLTGFTISNLPIAAFAITAVPNSDAAIKIKEYDIFNFDPGISNSGNKQYGVHYRWVKNPTLSRVPSYTTVNNVKYATFQDIDEEFCTINNSGKAVHTGILASSNNVSDEAMEDFPIIGNASPDVYVLTLQIVNDVGPTDLWYTVNIYQS
jgi:hypothetical protein